jgi:hypothetical protein
MENDCKDCDVDYNAEGQDGDEDRQIGIEALNVFFSWRGPKACVRVGFSPRVFVASGD